MLITGNPLKSHGASGAKGSLWNCYFTTFTYYAQPKKKPPANLPQGSRFSLKQEQWPKVFGCLFNVFCSTGRLTVMHYLKDGSRFNQYLSTSFNLIKHHRCTIGLQIYYTHLCGSFCKKMDGSQESQFSLPFLKRKRGGGKVVSFFRLAII